MAVMKDLIVKIMWMICRIMPKRKNLWVFGAWNGKLYADNSKSMFEYVNREHPEIKAVWLTKDKSVETQVRALGYRCYHCFSLKGIWATLRAGVAFETEGELDLSRFLPYNGTRIIQLWHGMGSKAMKWKSTDGVVAIEEQKVRERYSAYHWVSTSELYTNTISSLLGVPKERFVITGYPRNDALLEAPHHPHMDALREKYEGCRFLIYMPTHRNFGAQGNQIINPEAFARLDAMLREKKLVLVFKPHIHELKNLLSYESNFTNIILAKEQELWADVYSYLHCFDLLISDYSSVLTDFMCTGKPVVLFPYDIDDYINGDAGLNDYFWEIPGGPMCYTWDEVIETSEALLREDSWKQERERCRVCYHLHNDGKNCERVYDMAMDIVKNKKR